MRDDILLNRGRKVKEIDERTVEHIAPLMEALINARILRGHVSVLPSAQTPDIKILSAADVAFSRSLMVGVLYN